MPGDELEVTIGPPNVSRETNRKLLPAVIGQSWLVDTLTNGLLLDNSYGVTFD